MSSLSGKLKADIKQLRGKDKKPLVILFLTKKNYRIVILYRILNHFHKSTLASLLLLPLSLYYRLMTNRYCVDLPVDTRIGEGFRLNHCYCVVVNRKAVIGNNVYIGHSVTIGSNGDRYPVIGNNVLIAPGCLIIGDVTIGDNVIIGAGSLVVKNVEANSIVGGHPSRFLRVKE
ncbi:serine acetyltransferase [Mucilaginibacter sp. UR6-1]|uniref:serine acetyltransferase n=1 Tax=Mucilaginibacter sp. UR6-1 TaxID=1435643 RepID=UPI002729A9C8|nr:serine acetyltransferase [Mucilaginibacter sp. UR6-1]